LTGDLPIEVPFRILLATRIPLVDGQADAAGLEGPDDLGIAEGRRTVDDDVVSATSERISVHGPDEEGLAFAGRLILGLQERDFPRDVAPQLRCRRPERVVKLVEIGFRESLLGAQEPGQEER
jgi:hypothetical protein